MSLTGLTRRLSRMFDESSGRAVMLPIDQPVTLGPLPGLIDLDARLPELLADPGPETLIAHRGALRRLPAGAVRNRGILMHLSAATTLSGQGHIKTLSGHVEDALRAGADGVSVQVTFGVPEETVMLAALAAIASECGRWGVPLLAMVYVTGADPASIPKKIAHAARAAAELGADIVKAPYTGSSETFSSVVESCFVPVLMAGGERADWAEVLRWVADAVAAGAAGVCIGRNIFQHANPQQALADLRLIVHKGEGAIGG